MKTSKRRAPKKSPAKKKPAADPAARKPMKISQRALEASMRVAGSRKPIETLFPAEQIFKPAVPPPGVVAPGFKLAMDDALTPAMFTWAQNGIADMFAEGMAFLGYPYLAELSQRPEYRRISEVYATESTREFIELKGKGKKDKSKQIGELEEDMAKFDVAGAARQMFMNDGLFGRGHVYIDTGATDDPDELKTPIINAKGELSNAKIKKGSLRAFKVIEPAWTYPVDYDSSDPLSDGWYSPRKWFVMGKEIDRSRLLTFIGRKVPDILKPAYSFGGLSLTQMAKPYVDNWLKTRQNVTDITSAFSVMVLATNMMATLSGVGDDNLDVRAQIFNNYRDNSGLFLIDKNAEDFKNVSASLASLDKLQAQALEHICSVTGIPLVKYTGISPSGLNASSEGEIRVFYDAVHAYQELARYVIKIMLEAIMISRWGKIDPDIIFVFKPLWALDEKAKAEVEKIKAETDAILIESAIIDNTDARNRLAGDANSDYEGLSGAPPEMTPEEEAEMQRAEQAASIPGVKESAAGGGGGEDD